MLGKILLCLLAELTAPFVCLFYRKGIYNTPDDPESPHGLYEPRMRRIYEKYGKWVGDYYWLGIRNRAYGLKYKFKPDFFKNLDTYDRLQKFRAKHGPVTYTEVAGYGEWVVNFPFFHVIYGYRMGPVYNTKGTLFKVVNMDARPILSIRGGRDDQ